MSVVGSTATVVGDVDKAILKVSVDPYHQGSSNSPSGTFRMCDGGCKQVRNDKNLLGTWRCSATTVVVGETKTFITLEETICLAIWIASSEQVRVHTTCSGSAGGLLGK